MYHKESGLFYLPPLKTPQLHSLHSLALRIPKVSDPIFKCEPAPGQLFTNEHCPRPDWVALQEGKKASEAIIFELSTGEDYGKVDLLANAAMATEPSIKPITSTKIDLAAKAAMATEPTTKPIDAALMVSGAQIFAYTDATWVSEQDSGALADDGKVVYLNDILMVRSLPDAKSIGSTMDDDGITTQKGREPAYPFRRGV